MSMVAIYKLDCCPGREMSFGRFIPLATETTCPLCGKVVSLHNGRYVEEHLYNIPNVHKYVLPLEEKKEELLF